MKFCDLFRTQLSTLAQRVVLVSNLSDQVTDTHVREVFSNFGPVRAVTRKFDEARARGIYLRPMGDTVYVTPPLNIPDEELTLLLDGVEEKIGRAHV